jgi:outer membrane immunogenic protein
MMRFGILLGAAAIGVLATPALAADLTAPEPLPTPQQVVEAAPANNWTGFYLGALGGFGWGTADTDAVGEIDADGFDIGGYAGGAWQWGNFVVGAEGDVLFPWRDGSGGGISVDQGLNGSLRARAGIALDRFLLYGTGGAALTDLELSSGGVSDEQTLWGWTAGAGVEGMITDNITARVEYRYTDYQDETFNVGGGPVESDFTTHTIRGGLGLKF